MRSIRGSPVRWRGGSPGFNQSLVSAAGARGVMQVTPATWKYVETVLVGRRIPHTATGTVQVGVAFLRQLLREFRGDTRPSLAAYVQGRDLSGSTACSVKRSYTLPACSR
jgi:Transglycosylase SLT domain